MLLIKEQNKVPCWQPSCDLYIGTAWPFGLPLRRWSASGFAGGAHTPPSFARSLFIVCLRWCESCRGLQKGRKWAAKSICGLRFAGHSDPQPLGPDFE